MTVRDNAPTFIKLLVAAGLANEIDREDSIVDIELYKIRNDHNDTERLALQLWFSEEDSHFQCVLESMDSKGTPRYLGLFSSKTAAEFKEQLLKFFSEQSDRYFASFPKICEILKLKD